MSEYTNGRLTFRTTITVAVMAFITALAACLILIQAVTFPTAARDAGSAYMDAASANALGRLEARVSGLASLVRVLSKNPFLADSDDGPFAAAGAASALRGSRPDYAPAVGQIGCFRRQNRVEWPFPPISGGKTASRRQQLARKSLISSLISLS